MKTLLLLLALSGGVSAAGPEDEAGVPLLRNLSTEARGMHQQNWAVVQDSDGVMLFGNTSGVFEYDGSTGRLLQVTNTSIVRSLAVDDEGRVFVGAVDELGFLERDAAGTLRYVSLIDRLAPEDREIGDVWRIFPTTHGVYFWSGGLFLRLWQDRLEALPVLSQRVPAMIGDRLYNNHPELGLTVLEGDVFVPLPGGEALADVSLRLLLPYPGGAFLVGTNHRLFVLAPRTGDPARFELRPFPTGADDILREHRLYHGIRLWDGTFALATMTGGAFVIDEAGNLLYRLDKSRGLRDDSVWYLYQDHQGGLWLALNRGLARAEVATPFTAFGEDTGLLGAVEAVVRHRGEIYAATGVGLFRLAGRRFSRVPGIQGPCWSLLDDDPPGGDPPGGELPGGERVLLVGSYAGVHVLDGEKVEHVADVSNVFALFRPASDRSTVFAGGGEGLFALRHDGTGWNDLGRAPEVDDEVRSIEEDRDGALWVGTRLHGALRLIRAPGAKTFDVTRFGNRVGSPNLQAVKIRRLEDRLLFATPDGLFELDAEKRLFVPSPLGEGHDFRHGILRLEVDFDGRLWTSRYNNQGVEVLDPQGRPVPETQALRRLGRKIFFAILPEADGTVWLGGTEGLFRYRPRPGTERPEVELTTLVRAAGGRLDGGPPIPREPGVVLPYTENAITFVFSLTSFDDEAKTAFSYVLEGHDEADSPWGAETTKEYLNVPEGDYTFRVRGRDVYGQLGREAVFPFTVLPPWYRTFWAWVGYVVMGFLVVFGSVKLRSRQLERERNALEAQRATLAREIEARQAAEVERERLIGELEAKNVELERFTYTVSHDLKSPLFTICGFLGLVKSSLQSGDLDRAQKDLEEIDLAAYKMSRFLDNLLELSRGGRLVSDFADVSLTEVIRTAMTNVAGAVAERGVEVEVAEPLPDVRGDRTRLVQVFQNLLDNAVKFLGDTPRPRIEVGCHEAGRWVECWVRDNGRGIELGDQEKIFDLFEKLDAEAAGTGVGLALVKRIVDAHGGRIGVESAGLGQGSTFRVTLPACYDRPMYPSSSS